jgi:hypothetical protein
MERIIAFATATLVGLGLVAGGALLTGLVTAWAWNGVAHGALGLPAITFWQGFQLNLLGGLLVKSSLKSPTAA